MKIIKKISNENISWDGILPCPFCSAPGEVITCKCTSYPDYAASSFVHCTRCGAAGAFIETEEYLLVKDSEKIAIKKWNKRGNTTNADEKLRRIALILNGVK